MKKMIMFAALAAIVGVTAGCFTSATAYTKRTDKDGAVTESRVSIVGTGDKASQVAAEGLFADGAADDLGAGVKNASASQQSTGIEGTLNGLGVLMGGMAQVMAASQGVKVPAKASAAVANVSASDNDTVTETAESEVVEYIPATKTYSTDGYDGAPGADGSGIYGQPSCSRCRAYKASHPDVKIINLETPSNGTAMWSALKKRGFTGSTAALPVEITATGFVFQVK